MRYSPPRRWIVLAASICLCVIAGVSLASPPAMLDLDTSGVVDAGDVAAVTAAWGSPGETDLDGSGSTDSSDLARVLAAWGERWEHAWSIHRYGGPTDLHFRVRSIEFVREGPWSSAEIGYADERVLAGGSVRWWIDRMYAKGWSGPVFVLADTVQRFGVEAFAAPVPPPSIEWVFVIEQEEAAP